MFVSNVPIGNGKLIYFGGGDFNATNDKGIIPCWVYKVSKMF